ncbi:MAG: beta strand repeat-containing protein, partial [Cellvibrionaceae bacterium]
MKDAKGLTVTQSRKLRKFTKKPLVNGVQLQVLALTGLVFGQLLTSQQVLAGPTGGNIVGGTGSIDSAVANLTEVTQNSARMAINWDTFNVANGETVRFVQPSSSAFVLNKILDQNPSSIQGSIDANGNVLLVNPRGIMFSESATVNVGSLMASGLAINADDFMNGDFVFDGIDGDAGAVINAGVINAASVALLGKQVTNDTNAVISAEVVSLSAGDQAILTFDSDGMMGVEVTKAVLENEAGIDSAVLNSGAINGEKVLLQASTSGDLFTNAVNNTGVIRAQGIDTSGGTIRLFGGSDHVANSGTLDASGIDGGDIHVEADSVTIGGELSTDADAGIGGTIAVLGDTVKLDASASISSSGTEAGGTILIGGDYQGKNDSVRNARSTSIAAGAEVTAKGIDSGDGGKVIVWADDTTLFYGFIDASSGLIDGDGGLVETSGKHALAVSGTVLARGASGRNGLWLLDPIDVVIQDGSGGAGTVDVATLTGALDGGTDIDVTTISGDISVDTVIEMDGSGTTDAQLTLSAGGDLHINQNIQGADVGDNLALVLLANGDINVDANLSSQDGNISLTADADGGGSGDLVISAGNTISSGDGNNGRNSGDILLSAINISNAGDIVSDEGGMVSLDAVTLVNSGTIQANNATIAIDVGTLTNTGVINAISAAVNVNVGSNGLSGVNQLGTITGTSVAVTGLGATDEFKFNAGTSAQLQSDTDVIVNGYTISGAEIIDTTSAGSITASTATENFSIVSANSVDITTTDGTVKFVGVSSVDAGEDAVDGDVATGSNDWSLVDSDKVETLGIVFTNLESASTTNGIITGSSGDDQFDVSLQQANVVETNGVTFSGINEVAAGGGSTDEIFSSETEAWQVTDTATQLDHNGIVYTGLEQANAGAGSSVLGTSAANTFSVHA